MMYKRSWFNSFAKWAARASGHPAAFLTAVVVILAWAATGPAFGFGNTWQLVINTGTTIVTFLMVFLIQNTQNRDSAAIHIKLDELIRSAQGAHNAMLDLEELGAEELELLRAKYEALAARAKVNLQKGLKDVDCPDLGDDPKGISGPGGTGRPKADG